MNPKNTHVDTAQTTTHIGLCAGYGGIELGLKRVIPDLRTVALCEIEAFACANLVAKMEAGLMDAAPIWSDLKTFPWAEFHRKVDILTGGYPCQPFSAAGKRAGKDDPRHLWPWIADGIRLLQPRCCFFENVQGHITLGLSTVISDLEEMGYRTTFGIFSASEVGAPHQRKRVFVLAYSASIGGREDHWIGNTRLAHQADAIWPSRPGEPQHEWEPPRVVGNAKLQGLEGRTIGGDDNTEELAKGCAWETESSLGRDADGPSDWMDDAKLYVTCDNRTDELRLLGNGVVPTTAERAFRVLMAKL